MLFERNKIMKLLIEAFDLRHTNDLAVDLVGKCPITIFNTDHGAKVLVLFPMDEEAFSRRKVEITQSLKACGLNSPFYLLGAVRVVLSSRRHAEEQYQYICDTIQELVVPETRKQPCPVCAGEGCDTAAVLSGRYVLIHKQCLSLYDWYLKDRIETGGNYFRAFLGAMCGALVVAVASIILGVIGQNILGWVYAFSAVSALLGYKMCDGRNGIYGYIIIVICCIFAFIISLYCIPLIILAQAGIYLDTNHIGHYLQTLTIVAICRELLVERWGDVCSLVLGIIFIFVSRPLSKAKNRKELERMAKLTVSLQANAKARG